MDLTNWNREKRPDYPTMVKIGQFLLAELSGHLGIPLVAFREHYVEEGSVVVTFHSTGPVPDPALPTIEGVVLFSLAPDGAAPLADAELLLFSAGRRLCATGFASGLLRTRYHPGSGWGPMSWDWDCSEDWEAVTTPRTGEYGTLTRTYDPAQSAPPTGFPLAPHHRLAEV